MCGGHRKARRGPNSPRRAGAFRFREADRPDAAAAAGGLSVPELRAFSEHDPGAEHRSRRARQGKAARDGGAAGEVVLPRGLRGEIPSPALGRAAAEGGACAYPGERAGGADVGRALFRAGQLSQVAGGAGAGGAAGALSRPGAICDARPGRGAAALRPGLRAGQREIAGGAERGRAVRLAADALGLPAFRLQEHHAGAPRIRKAHSRAGLGRGAGGGAGAAGGPGVRRDTRALCGTCGRPRSKPAALPRGAGGDGGILNGGDACHTRRVGGLFPAEDGAAAGALGSPCGAARAVSGTGA